ncbi:MAG: ROK family protein, partial [Gammaproteobacteria bacterium]
ATIVLSGPLPRTEIARETGLTMASVSRISRDLIDAGLVRELDAQDTDAAGQRPAGPGRPFVRLDIEPRGGFVLGIGVNVFSQSVTLADLKNRRIGRTDLNLASLDDPDRVIELLMVEAQRMIDRYVPDRRRLLGGTFAITGAVDPVQGIVRTSPYLGWGVVSLGEQLRSGLAIPIRVESLPNAMALAETRFGVAREKGDLLLLNCSLGIGASLVLDGRLVRGKDFCAGLIGGIVLQGSGPSARTLDRIAGGQSVLRRLHGDAFEIAGRPANELATALVDAVERDNLGDESAARAMAQAGDNLGRLTAQFAALVAPGAIVVGGPLAGSPGYVAGLRQSIDRTLGGRTSEILISHTTGQAAARWLAIGEYLIEQDLDLHDLKLSSAA